jgi:hypothetical protein
VRKNVFLTSQIWARHENPQVIFVEFLTLLFGRPILSSIQPDLSRSSKLALAHNMQEWISGYGHSAHPFFPKLNETFRVIFLAALFKTIRRSACTTRSKP